MTVPSEHLSGEDGMIMVLLPAPIRVQWEEWQSVSVHVMMINWLQIHQLGFFLLVFHLPTPIPQSNYSSHILGMYGVFGHHLSALASIAVYITNWRYDDRIYTCNRSSIWQKRKDNLPGNIGLYASDPDASP